TYHCEYNMALQCVDNSGCTAKLRFFSPPGDIAFGSGTVSFVQARAYIPKGSTVLLEGIRQAILPGDPSNDDYQAHAPNLVFTLIYGIGIVNAHKEDLPVSAANNKEFRVDVSPWVRDENQSCTVTYVVSFCLLSCCLLVNSCVMPAHVPRWKNVPVPRANTVVYFSGVCGAIRDDGLLEITLDDLLFNLAPPTQIESPTKPPAASPPRKRQKFDASVYFA
ncbi:hypothetical protein LXA43DRAFT_894940, partial [Ganoderma leucocontextum]